MKKRGILETPGEVGPGSRQILTPLYLGCRIFTSIPQTPSLGHKYVNLPNFPWPPVLSGVSLKFPMVPIYLLRNLISKISFMR